MHETMDYQSIIDQYYPEGDELRRLLIGHSRQVADRCLLVAQQHPELPIDTAFVEEAAMLHDIGIRWCWAPSIGCHGKEHYLRHGFVGGQLLRAMGLERHARVCERHTGTGLSTVPVDSRDGSPLLPEDLVSEGFFMPETLEEQLVAYADKFYSKSRPDHEASPAEVARSLEKFGQDVVARFMEWHCLFG